MVSIRVTDMCPDAGEADALAICNDLLSSADRLPCLVLQWTP